MKPPAREARALDAAYLRNQMARWLDTALQLQDQPLSDEGDDTGLVPGVVNEIDWLVGEAWHLNHVGVPANRIRRRLGRKQARLNVRLIHALRLLAQVMQVQERRVRRAQLILRRLVNQEELRRARQQTALFPGFLQHEELGRAFRVDPVTYRTWEERLQGLERLNRPRIQRPQLLRRLIRPQSTINRELGELMGQQAETLEALEVALRLLATGRARLCAEEPPAHLGSENDWADLRWHLGEQRRIARHPLRGGRGLNRWLRDQFSLNRMYIVVAAKLLLVLKAHGTVLSGIERAVRRPPEAEVDASADVA